MVVGDCELMRRQSLMCYDWLTISSRRHIAGESTVFGTACNYVVCRILGMDAEHPVMVKARGRLHELGEWASLLCASGAMLIFRLSLAGGAVGVPAWGKMWLSILNVYDYEGMNPVPPELW